jgi:hypothetical protein
MPRTSVANVWRKVDQKETPHKQWAQEIFHTSYGTCRNAAIKFYVCSMITIAPIIIELVAAQRINPKASIPSLL